MDRCRSSEGYSQLAAFVDSMHGPARRHAVTNGVQFQIAAGKRVEERALGNIGRRQNQRVVVLAPLAAIQ